MDRKRGAQRGNKNAYKHGFYAQDFKEAEKRALEQISLGDLSGEIEFVRVQLKRFIEAQSASSQPTELETRLAILRAITLSAESINSMIRTQIVIKHISDEANEIIEKLQAQSDEEDAEEEV